jgi:hypothetical protein
METMCIAMNATAPMGGQLLPIKWCVTQAGKYLLLLVVLSGLTPLSLLWGGREGKNYFNPLI